MKAYSKMTDTELINSLGVCLEGIQVADRLLKENPNLEEAYILLLSQGKGSLYGKSSKFYTDVKSIIRAGMQFDYRGGTKDKAKYASVISNIGHKISIIFVA